MFLSNLFYRYKILAISHFHSRRSKILSAPNTKINANKSSEIILKGSVSLGFKHSSIIIMGKNSKLIFHGDVLVGPGFYINIQDNAVLEIGHGTIIGNNTKILCHKKISIGKFCLISWNVTLIDDDSHQLIKSSTNKKFKLPYRSLIIEDHVGIEMNTSIVRGICVGRNSSILSHTRLNKDLPQNAIVYPQNINKVKENLYADVKK
jgi:acetyltransferase-like isoleucine patch superfamily enzyme